MGFQFLIEGFHLSIGHPTNNQILTDRGANVAIGITFGQISHDQHLLGGNIARRQPEDGGGKSFLPLFHHVGASPRCERRGRRPVRVAAIAVCPMLRRHNQGSRIGMREKFQRWMSRLGAEHVFIGGFPPASKFVEPQFLDHELHAGFAAVFPIAEIIEDFNHGFDGRNQFIHGHEFPEKMRDTRGRPQPSSDHHAKSDRAVLGLLRQQADVVDGRHGAIVIAAGKRNFEFSRQALVERIAQQMSRHGVRVRGHVKDFTLADTGQVAGRDVADGVGAGFTSGEPHFFEFAHDRADLRQGHEVQLNILPGRDVADSRGIGLGQFGHAAHLVGRHPAKRNFDAHHLHVRLPLSIDAILQPERFEQVSGDVAGL